MPEYRPIELLKTAKDLCDFDAVCVGGPLHGGFCSIGKLPWKNICDVVESHQKSPVGNMRGFTFRLPSHMKYRMTLLRRRGMVYAAWVHESVPVAIHSELLASFDAALEFSKLSAPTDEAPIEAAPFEPGDRVAPNGGYIHEAVTVNRCFHRDGKWWFLPMHGKAVARDCACWIKLEQHIEPPPLDKENENAAKDATPDPKHTVLTDDEIFGPTGLWTEKDTYAGLGSVLPSGRQYADSFVSPNRTVAPPPHVNRAVAPFLVGQVVRWKSKGTTHVVEAIRYVDAEKCWAIRIPGHDRPYDVAMFEAGGAGAATFIVSQPTVSPPADPQPLGARPRRRIIRKERPQ